MNRIRKIYINSSHRTSGTSTAFSVTLAQDVECPEKCHCAISSIVIPQSLFSVSSGVNNKLYVYQRHSITESLSVNNIIEIASGNYSASALTVAIQQGLQAVALGSASYACSYSSVSQKISIQQTNGGGFLIYDDHTLRTLGRKNPASNGLYGSLPTILNPQSLNQVLNTPQANNPDVQFGSGVIILARTTTAYLRSPDLSNSNTLDSGGRTDVLARIPLTDFGTLCVGRESLEHSDWMSVDGRVLRTLSFRLTDSFNNSLDLHNHNISFCLNFLYGNLE